MAFLEVEPPLRSRPVVVAYRRDRLLSLAERAFLGLVRGLRTGLAWTRSLRRGDACEPGARATTRLAAQAPALHSL